MNEARLRTPADVVEYARHLASLLGLRDWSIELDEAKPDDLPGYRFATDAELEAHPHANMALLRVAAHLLDAEPEYQRRVIVHELLHCHRARSDRMVREDLEDLIGKPADRLFWAGYSRQREIEIESVATVLAPFLPLPR